MSIEPDVYRPKHHIRTVTATSLFDGHDAAIIIMRRILQSTGVEVIHLIDPGETRTRFPELHESPEPVSDRANSITCGEHDPGKHALDDKLTGYERGR